MPEIIMDEEFRSLLSELERCTCEKRKLLKSDKEGSRCPHGFISDGIGSLNAAIIRVVDDFYFDMWKLLEENRTEEVKAVMRSYLDVLEDLYRHM